MLPGWKVHVQCLLFRLSRQSLLSLLSFRGRPRFRLPCLPSPFLLPVKPSVTQTRGQVIMCRTWGGCSSPHPGPPQEQKHKGEQLGVREISGAAHSFEAQVPGSHYPERKVSPFPPASSHPPPCHYT